MHPIQSPKKLLLSLLLVTLISSIYIPNSYASCMQIGPTHLFINMASAQFLFEGHVESVGEALEPPPRPVDENGNEILSIQHAEEVMLLGGSKPYEVSVSRAWRGDMPNKVTVYGGGWWRNDIEVGKTYFFVINQEKDGEFYLGSCSPSTYSLFWGRALFFSIPLLILVVAGGIGTGIMIWRRKRGKLK